MERKMNRNHAINDFDLLLYISGLLPVFTALIDGTIINKVLFFFLLCVCLFIILHNGVSKSTCLLFLILIANYIIMLFVTAEISMSDINMFFYYPFMVLYSLLIIDHKNKFIDCISRNKKYVLLIIRIWSIIVGISIFMPVGYYIKEGGSYYFGSFAGSIFRLGPSALFIMSFVLISMSLYKRKRDFVYTLIPMYCFFMGSSRTYLVSGLCLFVVAWYWFVNNKRKFWLTIIPICLLLCVIMWNSSMGDKIRFTLDDSQYGDFWFRVTSSRSEFWMIDLIGWTSQDIVYKIFGCGLFFTQELTGLWAHNDFIELLCSFGVIGVLEYCVIQFLLIKTFLKRGRRIPVILSICVVLCWLFNAFFNMYYTYFCSLLSYPYVLISVFIYYQSNQSTNKTLYKTSNARNWKFLKETF